MDRFLSNTVNKVDKKGLVSIPASFRPKLGSVSRLFVLSSADQPCMDAGGEELLERKEKFLDTLNPFSIEHDRYSLMLHAESEEVKIDSEGRIAVTPHIRSQTGIENEVAFVGRGHFFQIWEPGKYQAYRDRARQDYAKMRAQAFGDVSAKSSSSGPGGNDASDQGGREG